MLVTKTFQNPNNYKDCTDEQMREMVKAFDFNDAKYCFFTKEVDDFIGVTIDLPKRLQLSEDNFYYGVRRTTQIKLLLERSQDISPEDKAWLEKANPYFKEVIDAKIKELRRIREDKLAVKSGIVPKTDAEELFEEIIKPYKGKVVVVDFWNTWCLPCLSAIKEIEPLKSGELSSDDIVWLYLADESSPETAYNERIQNIKGVHFRLSAEQANTIKRQFGITAIPSYVLVDRDGEYALCNDLHNIEQMKKILKEKIK
jgi:thiol-disulfide isomerase/thioredoxin